jgi:small subunit ribosomal protein S16
VVKIRLKRMGTTKRPVYRLVVADSRSPRDGRFIEEIGFYDPLPNPAVVRIDEEKVRVWMRRGARPSDTARDLLVREGILAQAARRPTPAQPAETAAVAAAPANPARRAGDGAGASDSGAEAVADGSGAGEAAAEAEA